MGIWNKLVGSGAKVTKSPSSWVIEEDLKKLGIGQYSKKQSQINTSLQDKPKSKEYKLEPIWQLLDKECTRK